MAVEIEQTLSSSVKVEAEVRFERAGRVAGWMGKREAGRTVAAVAVGAFVYRGRGKRRRRDGEVRTDSSSSSGSSGVADSCDAGGCMEASSSLVKAEMTPCTVVLVPGRARAVKT